MSLKNRPGVQIVGFGRTDSNVRNKVNRVFSRMSTIIQRERDKSMTPAQILRINLFNNNHRLLNHISKSSKYSNLSDVISEFHLNKVNLEVHPYERKVRPGQRLTSSFENIRDDFYCEMKQNNGTSQFLVDRNERLEK